MLCKVAELEAKLWELQTKHYKLERAIKWYINHVGEHEGVTFLSYKCRSNIDEVEQKYLDLIKEYE